MGSYFGNPYLAETNEDFEKFMAVVAGNAGVKMPFQLLRNSGEDDFIYVKNGTSNGRKIFFVFFPDSQRRCRLKFNIPIAGDCFTEMQTGNSIRVEDGIAEFSAGRYNLAILAEK